jgi:DNA mismatch endonuclease (patch repair protein)
MPPWPGNASRQRTTFGGLLRSELMSRVRSRGNTTTEIRTLALLRRQRISGWRRHLPLPGRPDFAWPRKRVAVFIDGCFWHGHRCERNLTPRHNANAWRAKIAATQQRDSRNACILRTSGWIVVRIWECKLRTDPGGSVRRIKKAIERGKTLSTH